MFKPSISTGEEKHFGCMPLALLICYDHAYAKF